MLVIVSFFVRQFIIISVQIGIFSFIGAYIVPLFNKAVQAVMETLGVSEDTAHDILANEIIQTAETLGLTVALSKAKLPLVLAEKLGFTSKGFNKRKLAPEVEKKTAGVLKNRVIVDTATVAGKAALDEVSASVAIVRGLSKLKVVAVVLVVFEGIKATTNIASVVGNWIDFANWSGTYKQNFVELFAKFGFKAIAPLPKANTISQDAWKKIYTIVEELEPEKIAFPWLNETRPYSRQALVDAVDHFASNLAKENMETTYKNVWGLLLPTISFKGAREGTVKNNSSSQATSGSGQISSLQNTTTKVFTGVISQGVVGGGLAFVPRPDDLIESVAELRSAAANNLAPFLASLPSKVIYEVKVVSSITTKDGFRQTGSVQKLANGVDSAGKTKYKTVTNKFAILVLYLLTDKNTRSKLTTIVLGPVDSVRLSVAQNDLRALELQLSGLVTTSNIKDIKGIETANPITITTPAAATAAPAVIQVLDGVDTGFRFYSFIVNSEEYLDIQPWLGNIPTGYTPLSQAQFLELEFKKLVDNPTRWKAYFEDIHKRYPRALAGGKSGFYIKDGIPYQTDNVILPATVPVVSGTSAGSPKTAQSATTLFEWYQTQGQAVPPVSARALVYAGYGLGQSSYYFGTTEQNTKLLAALKGGTNVQPFQAPTFQSVITDTALRAS